MIRTVCTELGEVSFELQRKRVKNINLRVRRDGTVYVSVPYRVSFAQADDFVKRNGRFIFSSLDKMRKMQASERQDKVCYLGEEVEVSVVIGDKTGGTLQDNRLVLSVREDSQQERDSALDKWRRKESEGLFTAVCREKLEVFRKAGYNVPFPRIYYRKMKSRWGSCTAGKGKITLNIMLIEKPMICIEYVVTHELAHFVVQDHSDRFYTVMDRVMPKHREIRRMMR